MKKFLLLFSVLLMMCESAAQYPTNLDRMNELLGVMLQSVGHEWSKTGVKSLRPNLDGDLKYFEGRILQEGKALLTEAGEEYILTIADVKVSYRNPERNGFFGEMIYIREVIMRIEWYSGKLGLKEFSSSLTDTIPENNISEIEQAYLAFTVGKKEDAEFFNGYFEEITAAVVTGVAAYLFFSVRSK